MVIRFELYSAGPASPDAVWSVVGDLRRLPAWTDAEQVLTIDPEPVAVGSELVVAVDGERQRWRVVTLEPRLIEARLEATDRTVTVGVRVAPDSRGARVILAGSVDAGGALGSLRARAVTMPALRRRMDRWANAALQVAGGPP